MNIQANTGMYYFLLRNYSIVETLKSILILFLSRIVTLLMGYFFRFPSFAIKDNADTNSLVQTKRHSAYTQINM